ncbi:MAG: nuclear transport factor 2 family protein [Terriglobales bacterium]
MKRKWHRMLIIVAVTYITFHSAGLRSQTATDKELLRARENVWRAWFAGDTKTLKELVPPGTIVMSGGEKEWKHQNDVLRSSAEFHSKGGKLIRLEFPRTEIQRFGDVVVVWSTYVLETEVEGKRSSASSRVTEIFVYQHGHWTNPGWHTDKENEQTGSPAKDPHPELNH